MSDDDLSSLTNALSGLSPDKEEQRVIPEPQFDDTEPSLDDLEPPQENPPVDPSATEPVAPPPTFVTRNTPPQAQNVQYVSAAETRLKIGDDIGLTNKDQTLRKLLIGAGWDVKSLEGEAPDLDLSCFILNKDGQTRKDPDFVFYNNLSSEEGEVVHKGDSRTGAGDGDDEQIEIDLQALTFDVTDISLVLSIHDGEIKEQDFSTVTNLFLRFVNQESDMELCRLHLSDEFLAEHRGAAMRLGRLFRDGPKWRFHADVEIIEKGGLRAVAISHGIIVL